MSVDENKAVVRRAIEAFNARDVSAVDVYSEDVGRDTQKYLDTMPWGDHQVDIVELLAEAERVVAVIATQGLHAGEYHGMPPTGKHFTNRGVVIFRIQAGRVTEMDTYIDSLTVVKQLGGTVLAPSEGS